MLDGVLHSMYACSGFTLSARLSPELLFTVRQCNFVFDVMRMDVDCVTDVNAPERNRDLEARKKKSAKLSESSIYTHM